MHVQQLIAVSHKVQHLTAPCIIAAAPAACSRLPMQAKRSQMVFCPTEGPAGIQRWSNPHVNGVYALQRPGNVGRCRQCYQQGGKF